MISIQPLNVACKRREQHLNFLFHHKHHHKHHHKLHNSTVPPHHLKQRQVAFPHVVVVDFDVDPARLLRGFLHGHAVAPVVDLVEGEQLLCGGVDAAVELASEQVYSHDAEDEPEDQTHQKHVEDGRNRPNESVHHHLPDREDFVRTDIYTTIS